MERWNYVGTDPRLAYGTTYDLTVYRAPNGASNISVHKGLKERVYKRYSSAESFRSEWKEER